MQPVRKIKPNSRSFTGKVPSSKSSNNWVQYESALERDAAIRFDFLPYINSISEQPLSIPHTTHLGNSGTYTPDMLLTFGNCRPPVLVEIKYRKDLFSDWPRLKPKFKAARRYCRDRGWSFRILTEVEIRDAAFQNIKFLRGYRPKTHTRFSEAEFYVNEIINVLRGKGVSTPKQLAEGLYPSTNRQAGVLSALWGLLYLGRVQADLNRPLTMQSEIWLIEPYCWDEYLTKECINVWGH